MEIVRIEFNQEEWKIKNDILFDITVAIQGKKYLIREILPLGPLIDVDLLESSIKNNYCYEKSINYVGTKIRITFLNGESIVEIFRARHIQNPVTTWEDMFSFYIKIDLHGYLIFLNNYCNIMKQYFKEFSQYLSSINEAYVTYSLRFEKEYSEICQSMMEKIKEKYPDIMEDPNTFNEEISYPYKLTEEQIKSFFIGEDFTYPEQIVLKLKLNDIIRSRIGDDTVLERLIVTDSKNEKIILIDSPFVIKNFFINSDYINKVFNSKYHRNKGFTITGLKNNYLNFIFCSKNVFFISSHFENFDYNVNNYIETWSASSGPYVLDVNEFNEFIRELNE